MDISTMPTGQGSTLEVYAGKGNPGGAPFLKLATGSGLRGISFNYPDQICTQCYLIFLPIRIVYKLQGVMYILLTLE